MRNIASAMLVLSPYNCVTTTEFMPIGQQPISVMMEMMSGSFVNCVAIKYDSTGMIIKRMGMTEEAMYL